MLVYVAAVLLPLWQWCPLAGLALTLRGQKCSELNCKSHQSRVRRTMLVFYISKLMAVRNFSNPWTKVTSCGWSFLQGPCSLARRRINGWTGNKLNAFPVLYTWVQDGTHHFSYSEGKFKYVLQDDQFKSYLEAAEWSSYSCIKIKPANVALCLLDWFWMLSLV